MELVLEAKTGAISLSAWFTN